MSFTGMVQTVSIKGTKDIRDFTPQDTFVLALGNEGAGLSQKLKKMSDQSIRIPMDNSKAESINVAVCGGIGIHYLISKK